MDYSGYFMQEYIDRDKFQVYLQWFQRYNHIFPNLTLDGDVITNFENEAKELVENMDNKKTEIVQNHDEIIKSKVTIDELFDSDEEDDGENIQSRSRRIILCGGRSFHF